MKSLFSGRLFNVVDQQNHECVIHPGASVVLPFVSSKKKVLLVKQNRPCVQETLWELPAGIIEAREDSKQCALRELQEETGYRAARFMHLCSFYTSPGFSNEKIHAYLAEDLHFTGRQNDALYVELFSLDQIKELITSQKIFDAKTLLVLLHFLYFKH